MKSITVRYFGGIKGAKRGRVVVTNIHPALEMSASMSLLDLTLMEKQVVGSLFGSGTIWTVTDHHQPTRLGFPDAGEDLDDVRHALHGPEVGDMDENLLTVGCEAGVDVRRHCGAEPLGVHEVRDHAHLPLDVDRQDLG